MAGAKWTPEEDAIAIRMAAEGHKPTAIGKALGRTRQGASNRLHKLGVVMVRNDLWPKGQLEHVKRRWAEGASATIIAREIGGGHTKNSVIGALKRAGIAPRGPSRRPTEHLPYPQREALKARRKPMGAKLSTAFAANPKPKPRLEPQLVEHEPMDREPVTLLELTACRCKWPVGGEGADTLFCGAGTGDLDKVYCPKHARRAYQGKPANTTVSREFHPRAAA